MSANEFLRRYWQLRKRYIRVWSQNEAAGGQMLDDISLWAKAIDDTEHTTYALTNYAIEHGYTHLKRQQPDGTFR